jgi:hypothetical protein
MTFKKNLERRELIWKFYQEFHEKNGHCPTFQACADALGLTRPIVKHYIDTLAREGKVKIITRRVYMVGDDGKVIDQRKAHNEATYEKKARAGRAGAAKLRRAAEEQGISPSALARIPAKDDAKIEKRIQNIVARAKEDGSYCHPRPVYVVLVGQKTG